MGFVSFSGYGYGPLPCGPFGHRSCAIKQYLNPTDRADATGDVFLDYMHLLLHFKCYRVTHNKITYNIWVNQITLKDVFHVFQSLFIYILLY